MLAAVGLYVVYFRRYRFAHVALVFWFIALFPGRIGSDSLTLINLMRAGDSSDQWTAVYFRILWLLTFNGEVLWPMGLVCLLALFFSYIYFVEALIINEKLRVGIVTILAISPFIGNWGMTVNHETLNTAGLLLLIGILSNVIKGNRKPSIALVLVACILSLTSFVGSIAFVFFLVAYLFKSRIRLTLSVIVFSTITLIAGQILAVNPMESSWKYISLLGDIKCVVQHPYAEISSVQWSYLEKIGYRDKWIKPETCLVADYGLAALKSKNLDNPAELIVNWYGIVSKNPQLFLESRIQRTSTLSIPILFSPQPNMISQNYLEPVGYKTRSDLQQFSEVFKTSIDDSKFSQEQLTHTKPLEFIALFATFLFNQKSSFWGYGGLWMIFWILGSPFLLRDRISKALAINAPVFGVTLGLLLLMPSPQPRYVSIHILLGVTVFICSLYHVARLYKAKLTNYISPVKSENYKVNL
jgi:hypothetical protein